jgi:integrase
MASIHREKGRHRVKYSVTVNGVRKQHSASFATAQEAERFARSAARNYEIRGIVGPERLTVAGLAERFLNVYAADKRGATQHFYRMKLAYLVTQLGSVLLHRLTVAHLNDALAELRKQGGRFGQPLSDRTVMHIRRVTHTMIEFAISEGLLAENPAARTKTFAVHDRSLAPTENEATRLLDVLAGRDPWTPFVLLAWMTGLRRQELIGLPWNAVDMAACSLSVVQVCEQFGATFRLITQPKTRAGARTLQLDDATVAMLQAWRIRQSEVILQFGLPRHDDALVFANLAVAVNQPYAPDTATRTLRDACRKAGWRPGLQPVHGYRHRQGWTLKGVANRIAMERLGHASVQSLLRYQGSEDADRHEAAAVVTAKLGRLIQIERPGSDARKVK